MSFSKIVAGAGIWSPPDRQQFASQNLRCPSVFEIRIFVAEARIWLPPGRQQFGSQNLRLLVFFEILKIIFLNKKN